MIKNGMRPVHPGEILREDYMLPLGCVWRGTSARMHSHGLTFKPHMISAWPSWPQVGQ